MVFDSLSRTIQHHAIKNPDHPALVGVGVDPLTYHDLATFMHDAVCVFGGAGLSPTSRVALVMPNGPHMAGLFLVVAASMTAAPLNPTYTLKEFMFYLHDLQADALLILHDMDSPAREAAEMLGSRIIDVKPLPGKAGTFALHTGSAPSPAPEFNGPGDTALILHTSGTTSRPKIVPLTVRNLVTSAHNVSTSLALTPTDRCLNIMPLFHIHGLVGALLSTIHAGASIVCSPGFFAPRFFDWLAAFRPSWYSAVPTMHQGILARAADNQHVLDAVQLRFIRSSSSAMPIPVIAQLEETFNAPVIEAYGMTEAAHQIAINPFPPKVRKPGSVGLPYQVGVAILDENGVELPANVDGEIAIRGVNVTRGYENAPEANSQAYINGWMRTGDQGRFDDDGYLFITGRLKEIINRGGQKVSPREIDDVLLSHPAVAQAATFALPHDMLGEDVAAVIVLRPDTELTDTELRAFATERLAYYKVPHYIVFRDEIPKGPTGKIQRVNLADQLGLSPGVEKMNLAARTNYIAPRTPMEREIAAIWAEVLEVETVGAEDDFLQLGGDSMLAIQAVYALRKAFNVEISLSQVLENPTVAHVSLVITDLQTRQIDEGDLSDILSELDSLSDDEINDLLES